MRNPLFRVNKTENEQSSKGVVVHIARQRYRRMKSNIADKTLDSAIEAQFSMIIPDLPPILPLQNPDNNLSELE